MPNAVLPFTFPRLRRLAAANLAFLLVAPHFAAATTTLTIAPGPSTTQTLAPAPSPTPADSAAATRTIVLVGEKPFVGGSAGRPLRAVELSGPAAAILGGRIIDLTRTTSTLETVQGQSAEVLALRPTAVLILAGPADEKARTPEVRQTYPLQSFARRVTETGASVFVLPASTSVGAAESALLRIGATGAGPRVSYVDLGGELSGRPFEHALENVRRELDSLPPVPARTPAPAATPVPEPTATPAVELAPETKPTATPAPSEPEKKTPATEPALPPALTRDEEKKKPTTSDRAPAARTPSSEDGRLRLSGPETTTATINMRPPAPLKQFSPRRPAPNAREDKKQPGFSR